MDGQERILRKLFAHKKCHHCGQAYEPERILVLARRSEVWMVMISCKDCEQKDTFVVKFPPQLQGRRHVTSHRIAKPPPATPPPGALPQAAANPPPLLPGSAGSSDLSQALNADDVLNMHLFLKYFDGDFQRLFSEVD